MTHVIFENVLSIMLRYHILHYVWCKQPLIFKLSNSCIGDRYFFRVHTVVLEKNISPGIQSYKRLRWKNRVLDLFLILFIKSELHCWRFAHLYNSEIIDRNNICQSESGMCKYILSYSKNFFAPV